MTVTTDLVSYEEALATYDPVMGLEVHVELGTRTKMFCGCSTTLKQEANSQTCPTCLGLPGALPVVNEVGVESAIKIGLALHCEIAEWCRFARKNYFYPDMPKNFQTSQYDEPIAFNGYLDVQLEDGEVFRVEIERAHMEEDTGKSTHVGGATGRIHGASHSLLDYNRAGIPLIEIVTKPIEGAGERAPEVAKAYYTREDIPLRYELVEAFGVCEAYHSSIHTSTSPDRNHLWSGRTGCEVNGARAVGTGAYAEGTHPGYGGGTYVERLEKAGVRWRTYTAWARFTEIQIEFVAALKAIGGTVVARTGLTYVEAGYATVRAAKDEAARAGLLATLEEGVRTLDKRERFALRARTAARAHRHARPVVRRGRRARRAREGHLPGPLGRRLRAPQRLLADPQRDHRLQDPRRARPAPRCVAPYRRLHQLRRERRLLRPRPPPVPGGDSEAERAERWGGRPTGLGVRVPMLVVSPWTVGGYVCSEVFDHTSVVRFLEKWTGVEGAEHWRLAPQGHR
ncbi:Glutamyl-tRNA(Gln) amidotransferase subunit B, chloroplastic/mitochondrial [Streptomyces alboniger]